MAKFIGRNGRYRERQEDGRDILFETGYSDVANACARGVIEHLFHLTPANLRHPEFFEEGFPQVIVEDENGKVLWNYGVRKVERYDIVREAPETV